MESRTQKAKKNIGMSVFQNMINLGITMVGRIVFARTLSSSYFGINGLFANVLGMLSIADLGMTTAMMYRMYKPLADNDQEKLASLVAFFRKVFLIIAAVVFTIGICLIPFLKYIVNLPSDIPNLYIFYFLNLIGTTMSYFFIYRTILVTADQKNYLLVRSGIVFKIITFILQMIVLICFKSYLGYLIVFISV
nr:polysaccharide biosynthesis protein [Butyrivibrio sp.]